MQALPAPDRIFSATLEETVWGCRFPTGLRVFLCPKPGFQERYACYSTFYGSVDDEFVAPTGRRLRVPEGIAHFLEHALFETEEGNASDFFAQRGAYSNAGTSFTTTTYLFAATSSFLESLDLLLRFVETPVFPPEKVEKERGIIEQEIQGYKDNPHWVSYMGLLEGLFAKHPMRVDIAGTLESIRLIDSEALHQCYQAFYRPSNMILFVVGDVEPGELFRRVAETSRFAGGPREAEPGGPDPPPEEEVRRIYPDEPREVFRREASRKMKVAVPRLLLGFKEVGVPELGDDYARHYLASAMALEILFGRSGDTFRDLYEAGLVLDDFGPAYRMGAGTAHAVVGGESPDPLRLREILLERISALVRSGIAPEDFRRSKRLFMGAFLRSFNSLEYIASNYTHFKFHDFDLFRGVDLLAGMDREVLEGRIRALLDPENWASFVVFPA